MLLGSSNRRVTVRGWVFRRERAAAINYEGLNREQSSDATRVSPHHPPRPRRRELVGETNWMAYIALGTCGLCRWIWCLVWCCWSAVGRG